MFIPTGGSYVDTREWSSAETRSSVGRTADTYARSAIETNGSDAR